MAGVVRGVSGVVLGRGRWLRLSLGVTSRPSYLFVSQGARGYRGQGQGRGQPKIWHIPPTCLPATTWPPGLNVRHLSDCQTARMAAAREENPTNGYFSMGLNTLKVTRGPTRMGGSWKLKGMKKKSVSG